MARANKAAKSGSQRPSRQASAKKSVPAKAAPAPSAARRGSARAASVGPAKPSKTSAKTVSVHASFPAKDRDALKRALVGMRDRLTGQIASLQGESLQRHDRVDIEEDGTDAFERQLALDLASSEQDALYEIDEALRRLSEGTYGVCEQCKSRIEKPRLKALPFVRTCVGCQSQIEKTAAARRRVV
jgi:RNA polymerase-binding transcription factor DksA